MCGWWQRRDTAELPRLGLLGEHGGNSRRELRVQVDALGAAWLFLDASRSRRRLCSEETCGSRHRVRRWRSRQQQACSPGATEKAMLLARPGRPIRFLPMILDFVHDRGHRLDCFTPYVLQYRRFSTLTDQVEARPRKGEKVGTPADVPTSPTGYGAVAR
jgi:hypothetical protein